MKITPLLTALLVTAGLYMFVFEREALIAFAQGSAAENAASAEADAEDDAHIVRVVAMTSEAETVDSSVVLRGRTEATRSVEVRAETSGLVISEPLRRGTFVEAGDLMCELDPGTRQSAVDEAQARLTEALARLPEAQSRVPAAEAALLEARARVGEGEARLMEARARLQEAEINRNASRSLSEGGFASESRVANSDAAFESARAGVTSAEASLQGIESQIISAEAGVEGAIAAVESARAQIQSAEAAVASAEREIERLSIHAPFDGLLESDTAELGSLLQPGGLCAEVIQLDPIKVVGFVPEAQLDKISVGARAGARLASGREVMGEVIFLSRSGDETTRTFRLEIEVANADLTIRDGQTADILVEAEGQMAHLLPQSALTLDDEGHIGVRTVGEGNVARFAPVTIIRDTVDGVWVSGLDPVVDIIVVGQEYVTDGVKVEPTFRGENG
ncbi:efflux RND transporter periplasmic adaptor subunit [Ponticoccus sp. SC2-23]|uniref:efflux RND transporter periplasmic adaptor subunit n=1 Tax=Alexandriicola marinus TaxID=2081710 RepID=UPI000FD831C8|nr:efflux RND transporter periplasmic adaptor subunit [Alexandriicola marinus]MBM1222389.1 efflux RND transporter periplasmic adaptor subunit [Ponticoccus sp. SC6-9]MBM1224502.1 efflux RND transporter periplasmic adaptor subunit [Ponticoccus sp. SC6-15]MBM1229718.1 efflux RND transporter periplasmic adaptor subunit [Ponticoccus sp. SC6-38]MBM1233468.1 efflux RND transporter periplasmic adaptor subunit [Ponticoccus sp. SC6-45]MBM1236582.1 efflux RND transporter periplasmic adaptor subunit [Pont